jgi:hypothetical protein
VRLPIDDDLTAPAFRPTQRASKVPARAGARRDTAKKQVTASASPS